MSFLHSGTLGLGKSSKIAYPLTSSRPPHPTTRKAPQSLSSPPWAPQSRSTRIEPYEPFPLTVVQRIGLTVSLSAKISLMLKMLREMCATGSPPKVTLAERSYQVPRTSSSTFLPSDSFLKVTVDSLARTVVVRERLGESGKRGMMAWALRLKCLERLVRSMRKPKDGKGFE